MECEDARCKNEIVRQACLREFDDDARSLGHHAREDAGRGHQPIIPVLIVSRNHEQRGPECGKRFGYWVRGNVALGISCHLPF